MFPTVVILTAVPIPLWKPLVAVTIPDPAVIPVPTVNLTELLSKLEAVTIPVTLTPLLVTGPVKFPIRVVAVTIPETLIPLFVTGPT